MKKLVTLSALIAVCAMMALSVSPLDLQHPNYAADYAQYMQSPQLETYVDSAGKIWQYDDERGPLYQTNDKAIKPASFDEQMSIFATEEIGAKCKRLVESGDEKAGAEIVDWATLHSITIDPCALVR